jgi:hypothetical protein
MSDLFKLTNLSPGDAPGSFGPGTNQTTNVDTGDLRRKFNFGDRISELSISQDPFFRFLAKASKRATDDPRFKFLEKRPSFHKRYAYVTGWGASKSVAHTNATVTSSLIDGVDDIIYVQMETDYLNTGNIQNIYNNSSATTLVGASDTTPQFFMEGQMVKINTHSNGAAATAELAFAAEDYFVGKVEEVDTAVKSSENAVVLKLRIVRPVSSTDNVELSGWGGDGTAENHLGEFTAAELAPLRIHDQLERARCYVVGNAHAEGSGYPETWKDQPYSTQYGQTQIWKTSMAMTNTARATQLKYDANEWARVWKEKLIEHKYDVEQSLLFGSQATDANGINYTQGAVDYILGYGNQFTLDTSTKSQDDFLDDLSSYTDPRYNDSKATVFFCSTEVYNWLHKLSGYFTNNLEISPNFRAEMALTGKKKVFGVDITTISTPYGDMNVARNIHLDGTNIKMLGINMKYCAYRPLVGNGLNRDTSVYVGVQTLENSGVDRRVDMILTEAGMEWQMPECHAVWKAS